jgi:hypothetical protein
MRRGGMRGDARQHLHSRGILARLAKPVLDLRGASLRFNTWPLHSGCGSRQSRRAAAAALFN